MSATFFTKLRTEIEEGQQRRHDFVVKKFTFGGALLGLGSLSLPVPDGVSITLLPLLYVVPLLAVAYDIYIVAEDYGIKRAGAFLKLHKEVEEAERLWEAFVNIHDRSLAPFGYFAVTLIFLIASSLLLYQTEPKQIFYWLWFSGILLIDTGLLGYSLSLRRHLRRSSLPEL